MRVCQSLGLQVHLSKDVSRRGRSGMSLVTFASYCIEFEFELLIALNFSFKIIVFQKDCFLNQIQFVF